MKRKITKQTALYLLEEAFEQGSPVLVHGTSVEAVIEMLSNGILPSSRSPLNQGYLYFVPRKKSFVNHPLYDKIKIDLEGNALEDEVEYYAQNTQQQIYLKQLFGCWPDSVFDYDIEPYGNISLEELKKEGVDIKKLKKYGLKKLRSDLKKRKGVVVGINERIFELKIEDGSDEPGREVMIRLPKGLDIKYVHHIFPFGELEEKALRDFIKTLPDEK